LQRPAPNGAHIADPLKAKKRPNGKTKNGKTVTVSKLPQKSKIFDVGCVINSGPRSGKHRLSICSPPMLSQSENAQQMMRTCQKSSITLHFSAPGVTMV